MSNLDTTTPISQFEVISEDGSVMNIPVSSGKTLYQHNISLGNSIFLKIINDSAELISTAFSLATFLTNNGFTTFDNRYTCAGNAVIRSNTSLIGVPNGIFFENSYFQIAYSYINLNINFDNKTISPTISPWYAQFEGSTTIIDTVIEL